MRDLATCEGFGARAHRESGAGAMAERRPGGLGQNVREARKRARRCGARAAGGFRTLRRRRWVRTSRQAFDFSLNIWRTNYVLSEIFGIRPLHIRHPWLTAFSRAMTEIVIACRSLPVKTARDRWSVLASGVAKMYGGRGNPRIVIAGLDDNARLAGTCWGLAAKSGKAGRSSGYRLNASGDAARHLGSPRPSRRNRTELSMNANRVESDSLGPVEIPSDKLWGAQTAARDRAFQHRPRAHAARDDRRLRDPEEGGGERQPRARPTAGGRRRLIV